MKPFHKSRLRPVIIAHRGAPGRLENTIAGFLAGIARGAQWIELDLHQTSDGALVVYHDFELGPKPISQCTLTEAKRLARSLKRIDLPTLDEVLEAVPKSVGLGVEAKAPYLARALVSALANHGAADRALCCSLHFPTLQTLATLRPRIRTGILTTSRLLDPAGEIRRARAQALFQEYSLADRRYVREVHKAGFQFFVWTVNGERDLRRMLKLGVDGIVTDFPERVRALRPAKSKRR